MAMKKNTQTTDVDVGDIEEQVAAPVFDLPELPPPVLTALQPAPTWMPSELPDPVDPFSYSDIKNVVRMPNGFQCSVKFDAWDDYRIFLACADDVEAHGRAIHAECKSGKRGPTPDYLPTHAELLDAAQARIARELRRANSEVTKYQDRVDVDEASDVDVAQVKAWKKYRVNLNRIPEQAHFPHPIVWPVAPDDVSTALVSA
ncbi:virus tail fiber assembly protein lambda gpK [Collimonas sp. PA-H2]|uniref:tail fiber assembly protein n=1 Tax=Collimonas sp. PA-H2 TaxID=1881062 RepID=UPI000C00A91C|nr:tail fiber assembly protein [Collimonas sp. PA-H2]PFH08093.1 virus tail fiber assembly protein lambda gpK [Collimonas sp. PA-H2]